MVLLAALCHALWNIAAKRVEGDRALFVWAYSLGSVLLWVPVAVVVLVASDTAPSWTMIGAAAVSGALHVAYGLALQTGYDRADLGVVYPVARGAGPLLTMVVAVAVLGERPGALNLLGGLVVLAGVTVIATGGLQHADRLRAGLLWGSLTGAAIAGYTLWDDHAVTTLALLPIPYFVMSAVWNTALLTPVALRRPAAARALLRRHPREITVIAVLSPLAYVLVLQAMRTTPVSLVAPARESGIVVGSLLAWWLFKEPNPVRRLAGAVVVLGGITLLVV